MAAAGRKRAAGMLSSPPSVKHLRGGVGRDSDQCNVVSDLVSDLGVIRGNDKLLPEGFVGPLPPAKPSNASPAAGPSTSVPAVERMKEATIPVDESDEYWWDNNAQIFSMRYNKKVRYVPDQPVSEIPTAVLEGLFIPEDKENLEKYNEEKLANLQAHLAFSSALVSKYIFDQSSAKDSALEEKENDTKQLRQVTAELEVKVKTLENELIIEKKKMKAKRMTHKEEIDDLNAKKLSVVNELDWLRNELDSHMKNAEEVEMKLETEMTSWKSEKEDLLAQIAALKKQQKEDSLDKSLRLDDPAIIESEATILAMTAEGEDPVRSAAKTVLTLTSASSQPLPKATYNIVPVADLCLLIKQVLREELTNGLPLESFGKKMNEFAQRSQGNQGDMVKIYNNLASFQQRIEKLEETTAMHKQELGNLSEDWGRSFDEYSMHSEQIKALQDDLTGLSSESNRNQNEILKLFEEATRQWTKYDVLHSSINSRLDSLDEIRRLERLSRDQENTVEANSLRMEGVQICIKSLVARGVFPRQLLDDMSFMDMVKDKDGLLLSLNSDDNLHWRHHGSPRIHHDTRMQFDNRPLSPWGCRSTSRSPTEGERPSWEWE